jgi:endonuclease/exonuclease/phosphatase family metal-dependent hydrolase
MRQSNALMHALLASNPPADIILVQEPWYDHIGTHHSDTNPFSMEALGSIASPQWNLIYSNITDPTTTRAKVLAYTQKNTPLFSPSSHLDLIAHPSLQILDFITPDTNFHIVNVCHDVDDPSCCNLLPNLDLDPITPMLIIGDFNMHSPTWSPVGLPCSSWAGALEDWAVTNLLELLNEPKVPTCFREGQGPHHQCDSMIDLAWVNAAAVQDAHFQNFQVDHKASLGSDHTALFLSFASVLSTDATPQAPPKVYKTNPAVRDNWIKHFPIHPLPALTTTIAIETEALALHEDIEATSAATLEHWKPFSPQASPWWNKDCGTLATQL